MAARAPPPGQQKVAQQQQQQQQEQPTEDGAANPATGLKLAQVNVIGDPSVDGNDKRTKSGKFTMAQLRSTDGICPLQSGTNQFDSQKGKTGFGMPRNTQKRIEFDDEANKRWSVLETTNHDNIIRLQSGSNKFESQKLMTNFGTPRDVKGKHLKRIWELEFPEEAADYQPPINQAPNNQQQAQPQAPPQQQQNAPPNFR